MKVKTVIRLLVACAISLSAGVFGSLAGAGGESRAWYSALEKPPFTPPGWVFGPVWTLLYFLMGVAAFLVWHKGLDRGTVRVALVWFLVQLVLNALWSPAFFGLQRIDLALVIIVLLWAAVIVTTYYFLRISRPAGLLLIPYLFWVSFATILNTSIWWLNR